MGHDYLKYEGHHERFSDFDLWTLRHFFIVEAKAMEAAQPSGDTTSLRKFFEAWDWAGPGVFIGTDFSQFVLDKRSWELLLQVLQRAGDRIAMDSTANASWHLTALRWTVERFGRIGLPKPATM